MLWKAQNQSGWTTIANSSHMHDIWMIFIKILKCKIFEHPTFCHFLTLGLLIVHFFLLNKYHYFHLFFEDHDKVIANFLVNFWAFLGGVEDSTHSYLFLKKKVFLLQGVPHPKNAIWMRCYMRNQDGVFYLPISWVFL